MNKNTVVIVGIIAIVVVGGLVLYFFNNGSPVPDNSATSTPITNGSTTPPTPTPPSQPQAGAPVSVTNDRSTPSDTTVVVTGKVTPNGAFTNYWYEYGTTTSFGKKIANGMIGSGFVAISAPGYITGLTKDTTYHFRLVSENKYGKSLGAEHSFVTTHGNPAPVGSAPKATTLVPKDITKSAVTLRGEVNPDSAITEYWFEYGKTAELGNVTAFTSIGAGVAVVPGSITLTDLEPATTYYFRLNAQNEFGTVNGVILNFKTDSLPVAAVPVVVTQSASGVSSSSATVHGSVNPSGLKTTYWFEYSTDSALGSGMLKSTPETPLAVGSSTLSVSSDLSGFDASTTYYFRVVAKNDQGTVRGNSVSFKTH